MPHGARNTERPITVSLGSNTLVGREIEVLLQETRKVLAGRAKQGEIPPLWDGHAADRIAAALVHWNGPTDRRVEQFRVASTGESSG